MSPRFAGAATALVLLTACGADAPSATVKVGPSGTYALRTVSGAPLPYVSERSQMSVSEVIDESLTLGTVGDFVDTYHLRTTTNGVATTAPVTEVGTFTLSDVDITLRYPAGVRVSGTLRGDSLKVTDDGIALVYVR